jgi:hypothetical protein
MLRSSENIQNSAFTTRENYRAGNCKDLLMKAEACPTRPIAAEMFVGGLEAQSPTMDVAAPQVARPPTAVVVVEEVASAPVA